MPKFGSPWTVGRMMLDTCIFVGLSDPDRIVASELPAVYRLFEYQDHRRIALAKTDTVDMERTVDSDPATKAERLLETAEVIEVLGPMVLDNSRLDHSVAASEDDARRLDEVFELMFPNGDRHGTSRTSKHNLRDAMHVATAIRYGYDGFVTTDDGPLLASARFRQHSNCEIAILTPTQAIKWIEDRIEVERITSARRP